jgi:hypothetical protein
MKLIEVHKEVWIDPEDITSVEHDVVSRDYGGISDCDMREVFNGTRITLKNGRKVFIDGVMPSVILAKIKTVTEQ